MLFMSKMAEDLTWRRSGLVMSDPKIQQGLVFADIHPTDVCSLPIEDEFHGAHGPDYASSRLLEPPWRLAARTPIGLAPFSLPHNSIKCYANWL
jgi:hypothetical protein